MSELYIITCDAGCTYAVHYVVEALPTMNEGIRIGTLFVNGRLITKFKTYWEAEAFVSKNR